MDPILNLEDLVELRDIIGTDGVSELVDLFVDDTEPRIAAIDGADDPDTLRAAAHAYKGAAAGVGALRVAAIAGKLEHEARAGRVPAEKADLVADLRSETERAKANLAAFLRAA